MATEKQTEANRQNARKSTGPRTPEGKARSCLNHLTTGIDAQSVVIPGENPADRKSLADRYFTQFQPVGEDERHQVEVLIQCDWLTQRLERCEAQTWANSMTGPIQRNDPNPLGYAYILCPTNIGRLDLRRERNERLYNRARHELELLQSARRAAEAAEAEAAAAESPAAAEPPAAPETAETALPAPGPSPISRFEPNSPTPATPKFAPESATGPLGAPELQPPKTA